MSETVATTSDEADRVPRHSVMDAVSGGAPHDELRVSPDVRSTRLAAFLESGERRALIAENPTPKIVVLPGTLQAEYRRCGSARCRCAHGEPHGPYFRREYWVHGRRRWAYVRLQDLETVRESVAAWQVQREQLRALRRNMRSLVKELNQPAATVEFAER